MDEPVPENSSEEELPESSARVDSSAPQSCLLPKDILFPDEGVVDSCFEKATLGFMMQQFPPKCPNEVCFFSYHWAGKTFETVVYRKHPGSYEQELDNVRTFIEYVAFPLEIQMGPAGGVYVIVLKGGSGKDGANFHQISAHTMNK
jgi:hypothetical protein